MSSPALFLRRRGWLLLIPVGLVAMVGLRLWAPSDDAGSSICFYRRCFGAACPGCGMTRALSHLVKGDWSTAVWYHPLVPLVALQAVVAWALWGLVATGRLRPAARRWVDRWVASNAVLLLGVWIARALTGTLPPV